MVVAWVLIFSGCSYMVVTSSPPGAEIYYAEDTGQHLLWKPWRPGRDSTPATTPCRVLTFRRDNYFLRTTLDGYHEPEPQLVEQLPFTRTRAHFDLEQTEETFEQQQRAKGMVQYKGSWVDPAGAGLVNVDGEWITREEQFAREQRAKGLVLYKGAWLTPEEKSVKVAEEYEQRGFIRYKDRWRRREQYELEKQIDATVDLVRETTATRLLDPPEVVGILRGDKVKIRMFNGTGKDARFLLSGTKSLSMSVSGYGSEVAMVSPGEYTIAVSEQADMVTTSPVAAAKKYDFITTTLEPGFQYSFTYQGQPEQLPVKMQNVDRYIQERFTLPTIDIPIDEGKLEKLRKKEEATTDTQQAIPQ